MAAPVPPATRIVVATLNPGKLREIREILGDRYAFEDLSAAAPVRFPEEGGNYRDNAAAKARAAARELACWAIADDSGLEVDGLDGAPGPYSARFGGPGLDDAARSRHLLAELAERPGASRRARFVCWAAAAAPDGAVFTAFGECAGIVVEAPRGAGGFGYDPVFQPDGFAVSMAELDPATKNRISHRARALRALLAAPAVAAR